MRKTAYVTLWVFSMLWPGMALTEPLYTMNAIGMRLVHLPAASFVMGTRDLEEARFELPDPDKADIGDESPAHRVTLSRPVWMAATEVSQGQWWRVMQNRPGPESHWQGADWERLPVVGVTWYMARRFAEELSLGDARFTYRLPTEAEWEYAARAGSTELRPVPVDELEAHAWYIHNSGDVPRPVASRRPNGFGLHDMLGNAWEWVADRYAPDTYVRRARGESPSVDPTGPRVGDRRVRRGGSYHCPQHLVRPGYRAADLPERRYSVQGFRVVAIDRDE